MTASRTILKGLFHTFVGSYIGKAVNFVSMILLTRSLLPEDFGIVAMALFFASSAGLIKEFGLDYALIHRQDELKKTSETHFFLSAVTAAVAFVLTVILFFVLRGHYDQRILLAMVALSATFTLRSLSATSRVMLEKDLRFSLLAWIDTTSNITTLILAVALAWLGFGFWSLVLAGSANSFVYILITSIRYWSNHWVSFNTMPDREKIRWFFSYGKWIIFGAFGTLIVLQYDSFMAGTILGVATLGFYERAYRFSQYPTDSITHVVSRLAMSVYAKYQDDREQLSYYFSFFLSIIVRIAFPLCGVIYAFADDIVDLVFGAKWLPMVSPLRWLLIYSLLRPIYDDTGAFFAAMGRPRTLSTILLIQAVVMLFLVPVLTYYFSMTGTAVSADIVMFIGVVLAYWKMSKHITIPYLKVFVLPSVCVIISYTGSFFLRQYTEFQPPVIRLALCTGFFLLLYAMILTYFERGQLALFYKYLMGKGQE